MIDIHELATGGRRRSSATVASAIVEIEKRIADCQANLEDVGEVPRLESLAMALRWVLGDDYDTDLSGVRSDRIFFGEDSAGI